MKGLANTGVQRGWPMVYVFAATESDRAELRETLRKMAKSYYDSLTMVTVDPLDFPELPEKLGLEPGSFPAGAVHQLSNDRIYRYPKGQAITPSALQKWGLDVWQGRVRPWNPA
jgi:protein disulfide-isomerase A1